MKSSEELLETRRTSKKASDHEKCGSKKRRKRSRGRKSKERKGRPKEADLEQKQQ